MTIRTLSLTVAAAAFASSALLAGPAPVQASELAPMTAADPVWMQSVYYGCNPRPHSEKAADDDALSPGAAFPTTVGPSGTVVILATTEDDDPSGTAQVSMADLGGQFYFNGTIELPGTVTIDGIDPGTQLYIQPLTVGNMAKILTQEQLLACGFIVPQDI